MKFFLIHMVLACTAPKECVLQQTVLDAFPQQEVCEFVATKLHEKLPKEMFVCSRIQSI